MLVGIVATLALGISLACLAMGAYGLVEAGRMAHTLSIMSRGTDATFDPVHWASHWRAACTFSCLLGLVGAVSGVAMYWRRLWSFGVWAVLVTAFFAVESFIFFSRTAVYAFEVVESLELLVLLPIVVASWLLYWRVRATSRQTKIAT